MGRVTAWLKYWSEQQLVIGFLPLMKEDTPIVGCCPSSTPELDGRSYRTPTQWNLLTIVIRPLSLAHPRSIYTTLKCGSAAQSHSETGQVQYRVV
jgi:hypothetical protein